MRQNAAILERSCMRSYGRACGARKPGDSILQKSKTGIAFGEKPCYNKCILCTKWLHGNSLMGIERGL